MLVWSLSLVIEVGQGNEVGQILLVGCWFVARSWWLVGRFWATKLPPTTWYHPVVGHKIASDYLVPPFLPPEISSSCGVVVVVSGWSVFFGP